MASMIKSKSFSPIIYSDTKILILGSLPGKKSLELKQYYGHARNRIWKILSHLTGGDIPVTYQQKKELLCKNKIGLWDVALSAHREGSLDSNIKDESPNDIEGLIKNYDSIKVIGFNGKKSEKMFYKYFTENLEIKYVPLPCTNPANMAISFEDICARWSQLFV